MCTRRADTPGRPRRRDPQRAPRRAVVAARHRRQHHALPRIRSVRGGHLRRGDRARDRRRAQRTPAAERPRGRGARPRAGPRGRLAAAHVRRGSGRPVAAGVQRQGGGVQGLVPTHRPLARLRGRGAGGRPGRERVQRAAARRRPRRGRHGVDRVRGSLEGAERHHLHGCRRAVAPVGADLARSTDRALRLPGPRISGLGAFGLKEETRRMTSDVAGTVAVVGLSCRLPGAGDPQQFWQLLRDGRDAIAETPMERWALQGISGPDDAPPGLRHGGFLDDVERFDARFFGVSPREAAAMDPQQRLALELCWEALEDAGIAPDALCGSAAGVYLGAIAGDYAELAQALEADTVARQTFTGTQRAIIANRVSYTLGLRGPSMTVDTGQSSSLVAIHLACQSLRAGESTVALAGGVQLNLGLSRALALSKVGALSPDGRCFTFDARANGFVRGEGGGVVVLKPLETAIADGDPIYCVIRASAVNNDGGGDGLTAPEQDAQEQLLEGAYRQAGLAVDDVQYVELHGTGTPLGDRVEAAALGAVLGGSRVARPLAVGSAKTNVGHLEAAAGVVGLLKVALAIQHGEIPASLNFERPNPEIPLEELGLRVPTTPEPWPAADRVLAGVSSFGIGGTNCHVVVEEPPAPTAVAQPAGARPLGGRAPLLGGESHAAVRDNARRLEEFVAADPQVAAVDVAVGLSASRTQFAHRAVVLGAQREELLEGLRELAQARPSPRVVEGVADVDLRADRPVFVFPGQGGQWA